LSASDIGAAAAGVVMDTTPPASAKATIAADEALTNLDISFCSFWKRRNDVVVSVEHADVLATPLQHI
jgi:hypothetical protein